MIEKVFVGSNVLVYAYDADSIARDVALIVQTALLAGAKKLLSEDFHHGQSIGGVTVENPFRF